MTLYDVTCPPKVRAHAAEMICTLAASGLPQRCGDVAAALRLLRTGCDEFRQLSESVQLAHVAMANHADPRPLERAYLALGGTLEGTGALGGSGRGLPDGERVDATSDALERVATEAAAVERAGREGWAGLEQAGGQAAAAAGASQREALLVEAPVTSGHPLANGASLLHSLAAGPALPEQASLDGAAHLGEGPISSNLASSGLISANLVGEAPIEIAHKILASCRELRRAAGFFRLNRCVCRDHPLLLIETSGITQVSY